MSWIVWVAVGVAIIVLPIVIGMVFSSGRNMYGGPGTSGGGMFGPFEEIFAPSRHEAGQELEKQKLRRADVGSPDGPNPGAEPTGAPAEESPLARTEQPAARPGMSDDPDHFVTDAPPPGWLDGSTGSSGSSGSTGSTGKARSTDRGEAS